MNNNEFTYIKEVAKQKSFSKASKALGISQPALSNYIKKLEDRIAGFKKGRNKNRKCCMFFNNIFAGTNVSLPQEISGNYF